MAKKKDLKSSIHFACDDLMTACMALALNKDKEQAADTILIDIQKMRQDYVKRISHTEPGMAAKTYFKNVIESFTKEVERYIGLINNL